MIVVVSSFGWVRNRPTIYLIVFQKHPTWAVKSRATTTMSTESALRNANDNSR